MINIFLRTILLLSLIAVTSYSHCGDGDDLIGHPAFEEITVNTPSFPIEALALIELEYEYRYGFDQENPSISFRDYMDQRLIDLYPDKAYKGLVEENEKEMRENLDIYVKYNPEYEKEVKKINDAAGTPFDFKMADYSSLTAEYQEKYLKLRGLAFSDELATVEDLAAIYGTNQKSEWVTGLLQNLAFVAVASLIGPVGGVSANLILICRDKAEYEAAQRFPGCTMGGTTGDAFRHIYVSVLLRDMFLSRVIAELIMETYEFVNPNQYKRDTYMDLHNNQVGNNYKYSTFHDGLPQGSVNIYANRVESFVNNKMSNFYFRDWEWDTPEATIVAEEAAAPVQRYIGYCYYCEAPWIY